MHDLVQLVDELTPLRLAGGADLTFLFGLTQQSPVFNYDRLLLLVATGISHLLLQVSNFVIKILILVHDLRKFFLEDLAFAREEHAELEVLSTLLLEHLFLLVESA